MKLMDIKLTEIKRPEWNKNISSNVLASYLIRHPEIIAKNAVFRELEFAISGGPSLRLKRRVDLVFEDDSIIYFVECENKLYKYVNEQIKRIEVKLEECKTQFLKDYKGNKKIENIMISFINDKIPRKRSG